MFHAGNAEAGRLANSKISASFWKIKSPQTIIRRHSRAGIRFRMSDTSVPFLNEPEARLAHDAAVGGRGSVRIPIPAAQAKNKIRTVADGTSLHLHCGIAFSFEVATLVWSRPAA
jgi:hypothetical protein